ncbi:CAF17-like 4Fe-4S cluster assembly/insertion protein YgfZ [Oryzicola mucosus]|uniref:Folate-binding protein YgfZ n=1 Tax=Oryzicola mucosus TaxID=2767425 RepID=A0A8J6PVY4_9HYPH|nr:folate-binding protein YgfZ [Oryzicola mucosus]MBD0415831.1 folate-binding protein YgfZ [Oryzicola mucosus]
MPTAILDNRALISVSGGDAEHFLQNILTLDLDKLAEGEARPGALLTPQGKILFDFLISRNGADAFLLECRADIAADFIRRLMLYRLRAKVEISQRDESVTAVGWRDDSSTSDFDSTGWLRDMRFAEPAQAWRSYEAGIDPTETLAGWHAFRIAQGVAESGVDYALGDAFPHDVLLDQNAGVAIRKGCYIGQEVVSRMHHRGTARRRVLLAHADGTLPDTGADIVAGGKTVGTLGSSSGANALAIVRIDRVKSALDAGLPIKAGDAVLELTIPAWATFTFPETAGPEAAATDEA